MRALLVASLLAAAVASVVTPAHAEEAAADKNVLVLTDDNFDSTLADIPVALVEFYAPWCGHCKKLEPEYNSAADTMAADTELSGAKLGKMDADAMKRVPGRFGVSGFPTIKLFRNGQFAEDFEGGRTASDIVAFMKKKATVAVNKEITSTTTFKKLTGAKTCPRTTVVGLFPDKESVDYKYFAAVSSTMASTGIDIYHVSAASVLESIGFFGRGASITMYRPGMKPFKIQYRGTIFKQMLKDWVMSSALPDVGAVYAPETEGLFRMHGASVVRFLAASDVESAVPRTVLEDLSKKHAGVKFAYASSVDYKADVEAHCDKGVAVCVLATEGSKHKKGQGRVFGSTGAYTADTAAAFVADFMAGELKVKVKSEPAPASPPVAGEVATLVGTNFEAIAGDASKDVLIEFYAPWCGHCKALAPKFDELAKDVADQFGDLLIAKMDSTANDLPPPFAAAYPVSGFPTLYYAPKGRKTRPTKYEGDREVAAFKKWLTEKRS